MGGPVDISGDQLRTIVERIEHIEEEIKELNEGKREIFQEAKSNGFDVKVIREIVRLRKQDQKEREEHKSLLEVYLQSNQGSSGSPRPPNCHSGDKTTARGGHRFSAEGPLKLTQAVLVNSPCVRHVSVIPAVPRRCRQPRASSPDRRGQFHLYALRVVL